MTDGTCHAVAMPIRADHLMPIMVIAALISMSAVSCAKKPPTRSDSAENSPNKMRKAPATPQRKRRAAPSAPPLSQKAQARLNRIKTAQGEQLCGLAKSASPDHDRAIIGAVVQLSFERSRSEADRDCFFTLLSAMGTNEALLWVAQRADRADRWLAVLAWAGRNLRARHFAVYRLALQQAVINVRLSAVDKLGRHAASPGALQVLALALADEAPAVRMKAVAAATDMDDPKADALLRSQLKRETDAAVKAAIAKRVQSR